MNLANLPLSELQALKAQLDGLTDVSGRTPIRPRQLHNLLLMPTDKDARPTFFWSAESPRDTYVTHSPWPALLWHNDTGREITVSGAEERAKYGEEWISTPPAALVIDPLSNIQDAFAGLSDEEQQLIMEAQKRDRIAKMQAKLADLSEEDLARLVAQSQKKAKKKAVA